ncbi:MULTISPECIES: immunoglobulin domain-containing protein [unclassified Ketobacter]|uniref:immunoglobulin domain-containing protein n=1 Tax=unclassified Ketobacter TaxID=2639109 RepID=UPI000F2830AB|nr:MULTISPECIES: immunoglobulin domain-containing protein [unclassified Ketobacter]RLT87799.1 MAG: hypothetical protein D9N13_22245 [Ketobacter sp. GenoA1]RLT96537.1 MAG: hypothetical protein D9N15_10525 [Ketobacter sp.]
MSVSFFPNGLCFNKVLAAFIVAFTLVLAGCGAGGESNEASAQVSGDGGDSHDETGDAGNTDPDEVPEEPEQFVLNLVSQPGNVTINEGDTYTFSVAVQNDLPITVTWYRNGSVVQSSASTSFNASEQGTYDCAVTDGQSTLECDSFSLNVTVSQFVTITTQPSNQMVNEGVDVTLSVAATGTGVLNYQWYFDGAAIAGANAPSLVLNSVTVADGGEYYVVVSNTGVSTTSNSAQVSVAANTLADALITWSRPAQRADDSALAESDIQAYEIYYAESVNGQMQQIDTVDASELDYVATGLAAGTHYFSLVTVDTTGLKSALSTPVSVTVN